MHVKIGYLARLRLLNGITALADLALMNLSLMFALCFFPHVFSPNSVDHPATMFLSWNIAYLLSILLLPPNGSHGLLGWAQVNGCRGETKTTDDMVRRIHLDIWYINHWSLALDLRIIWLTVRNMLGRDKGNAY